VPCMILYIRGAYKGSRKVAGSSSSYLIVPYDDT
jgi:hypothetical protein